MNRLMEVVTETRKIAHKEAVRFAMRGVDIERCLTDTMHGLANADGAMAALSTGYAVDGSASGDCENGFRLDLHGLPAAAEVEGDAPFGTCAVLLGNIGTNCPSGMVYGNLKKSKKSGAWQATVEGKAEEFSDPADAMAGFFLPRLGRRSTQRRSRRFHVTGSGRRPETRGTHPSGVGRLGSSYPRCRKAEVLAKGDGQ